MQLKKVVLIGAGNMATAIVGGLHASGFDPARVVAADPSAEQLRKLRDRFGVGTSTDNAQALHGADLAILAVKPQNLAEVATELASAVATQQPIVLSIAAGARIESIRSWLGGYRRIVRAMPNRPALLGKGITGLFAPPTVDAPARAAVEQVLRAVGAIVWVDREELLDAVTAVSGSGPAYFFLLIELLAEAGRELGLPPQTARMLAIETAYGAGCMAHEPDSDPTQLRIEVTSPGGTTAAALAVLENADLRDIVRRAVAAAFHRSAELAK